MEKFKTKLLLWGILLVFLGIGGMTLVCSCGSTQTAPPIGGDVGGDVDVNQKSVQNNTWTWMIAILGTVAAFLVYLTLDKHWTLWGRK